MEEPEINDSTADIEKLLAAEKEGNDLAKALDPMMKKMLLGGQNPQSAIGMSKDILESIYSQAYRLYNNGKYTDSAHLFRILIMMNAMETKYVLGLAACFQMLKDYGNAIHTYTMCSAIDIDNPLPHYHSSDCFIHLKDYLSAMVSLELTIARTENKPEYSKIRERALLSLENLKSLIAQK